MTAETTGEKLERLRAMLSIEQRTFVEEYLKTMNVREAYKRAFGKERHGSNGYLLLKRWYIAEYIAALTEVDDPTDVLITKEEILGVLAHILRDNSVKPGTRIRAAEVAFKGLGVGEKVTHEHTGTVRFQGLTRVMVQQIRGQILGVDISEEGGDDGMERGGESERFVEAVIANAHRDELENSPLRSLPSGSDDGDGDD